MPRRRVPDLLLVGHIAADLQAQGRSSPGGAACYGASTAAQLGLSVAVVTSAHDQRFVGEALGSIPFVSIPAHQTTTFENTYTARGRRQRIHSIARALTLRHVPLSWRNPRAVLLCPIAQEVRPSLLRAFPNALRCVALQGWLRAWDATGRVRHERWQPPLRHAPIDLLFFSREDVRGQSEADEYARHARVSVMTDGPNGAYLRKCVGDWIHVPATQARAVDTTGAGDVFAAAFIARYLERHEPLDAARWAHCAAGYAIEHTGQRTFPLREQVERRLRRFYR
ncbi:MAG: ribokinase [Chloroflexi bacterium]|nr:ribokinase [Chloroflexota bacterium]